MNRAYDAIVVGLGATGSAAVYALARRGVRVLGIDARRPPHTFGSHHGESRIIRKAYYEHTSYVPLLERAFEGWADLARRTGRRILLNTGGLMIGRPESELVSGVLASVREHRLPNEVLTSRTLVERFPQFRVDAETIGVWEADAGVLFPEDCIRTFLDGAAEAGADLRYDEPVREWQVRPGHIEVRTDSGSYHAGALTLCAGTGLSALIRELAPKLSMERQVVAHFEPLDAAPMFAPERFPIFCFEQPDGAFFYGFADLGQGVKAGLHHRGAIVDAKTVDHEDVRSVSGADIDTVRDFLVRHLPQANGALRSSAVCFYTNTPDLHFVVDRHPVDERVVVASACSGHGFKFASVMGEIVADLVRGTTPEFDLSMFRFDREA